MKYEIIYSLEAEEGVHRLRKSGDKQTLKKLQSLIEELKIHPEMGTGKPERLKGQDTNRWSRRITDKHRLIYDIVEDMVRVEIIQTYGHYFDR